jgi:hypothetical protein
MAAATRSPATAPGEGGSARNARGRALGIVREVKRTTARRGGGHEVGCFAFGTWRANALVHSWQYGTCQLLGSGNCPEDGNASKHNSLPHAVKMVT